MIHESAPVTNTYVSVPADMGQLNCAAFLAGIIAGVLDSARFVSSSTYCMDVTDRDSRCCEKIQMLPKNLNNDFFGATSRGGKGEIECFFSPFEFL